MKSTVFWDITSCSPLKVNRRFGGTYRLDLQGRISRARYQRESRRQAESPQLGLSISEPNIWNQDLPNTNQKFQLLDHKVRFVWTRYCLSTLGLQDEEFPVLIWKLPWASPHHYTSFPPSSKWCILSAVSVPYFAFIWCPIHHNLIQLTSLSSFRRAIEISVDPDAKIATISSTLLLIY
jgi:hypothetical protein